VTRTAQLGDELEREQDADIAVVPEREAAEDDVRG
jgi:hypothetical protein